MSNCHRLCLAVVVTAALSSAVLHPYAESGNEVRAFKAGVAVASQPLLTTQTHVCSPSWQSSASFECPASGIDGKKTPISFAVPLPEEPILNEVIVSCGGSIRLSVSFQRWDCYQPDMLPPKIAGRVVVKLPDGLDTGGDPVIPTDTCLPTLPASLIGILLAANGTPLAPYGVATTRITCCDGCGP